MTATAQRVPIDVPAPDPVEARARRIGRELLDAVARGSSIWDRGWWDDRAMALTMDDPEVKIQLFRFIDALPALHRPDAVVRHLREYLDQAGGRAPWWMTRGVGLAPAGTGRGSLLAGVARLAATHMAHKFIAGSTPAEALATVRKLRAKRVGFTADLLGEAVITEAEAETYAQTCIELLRGLDGPLAADPEVPQIDRDDAGPIPRLNLSLKLTSLTPRFDALYADSTARRVADRLRPILRVARESRAFVNIDMEQYAHKDLTLVIFRSVFAEPEFRDWADVGIVAQAYLPETEADLRGLVAWAGERGTPVTVRLVKGAYWDFEITHARQMGWPVPVFPEKWATDSSYERCARFLMAHHRTLRPALGSHNLRSLAVAIAAAEAEGVPLSGYEIQMLHGMGGPAERALVKRGHRVRVYTPYGAMLPGMAYLVRRLLENTSNESFLRASHGGKPDVEALLRNPEEVGSMLRSRPRPARVANPPAAATPGPFRNEPMTDFTRPEARARMAEALAAVREKLGITCFPVIDGAEVRGGALETVAAPGDTKLVVSRTELGNAAVADRAVAAARAGFPAWSQTSPADRAAVLFRAAKTFRDRRFELAAWEVYECGKPWQEADGDIAEAIDFCEFYAREMLRLGDPAHRDVPGETNAIERIARGVVVAIPPWNFPLAIPTGMVAAALVAGNSVILKPAEQSTVMAWHLFTVLREAGAPAGALHFVPGRGEEVGQALVDDRRVDLVSFTGSRTVGLEINRRAAEHRPGQCHVKRVIAEMGGKNAIVVDEDADLDEAVVGVVRSAFGYAGQKCSACSRVVVLDGVYDAFVARLADAARSAIVGPPEDPETTIGPVIDHAARERILEYRDVARSEGRTVLDVAVGPLAHKGHYVGPLIVADVDPQARVAQEEIFGPVLAVIRARDLDDAFRIVDSTPYALTAGLYSRSPEHIERFRREVRVGNLYINRPITGALVDRQPFGGYRLSGIGTKAGGTDYLGEFLLTRVVTENTLRRGFAPEADGGLPVSG